MSDDIRGIVFVGEPGSGKTSISEELMKMLGWDRLSFAAPLKAEVAVGLDRGDGSGTWLDHLGAMADPKRKDAYRPLLQAWGSFRRNQDENYWVNKLHADMIEGEHYVIDDCRYWNEYHFLRARGFRFVYLISGKTTRYLTGEQAEHESERDWPGFPIDMSLSYEAGPRNQAERVAERFGLLEDVPPETDCDCDVCQEAYGPSCDVDGCDCDCEDEEVRFYHSGNSLEIGDGKPVVVTISLDNPMPGAVLRIECRLDGCED